MLFWSVLFASPAEVSSGFWKPKLNLIHLEVFLGGNIQNGQEVRPGPQNEDIMSASLSNHHSFHELFCTSIFNRSKGLMENKNTKCMFLLFSLSVLFILSPDPTGLSGRNLPQCHGASLKCFGVNALTHLSIWSTLFTPICPKL